MSVRSDSTPDTSPEFGGYHRVPKRRIHRSSAPAQLTTPSTSQLSSPPSVITPAPAPATITTEPAAPLEQAESSMDGFGMDSEPSVNQDTDLEIEGGSGEIESIDPGMVECMEMEEEEDVNGDVIRCLCNESEEGGFMIQVSNSLSIMQINTILAGLLIRFGVPYYRKLTRISHVLNEQGTGYEHIFSLVQTINIH